MTWQLLNRLFGWEYAHLRNTADSIVRRVHRTGSGERFVRYFSGHLVFLDRTDHRWTVTDLTAPWTPPPASRPSRAAPIKGPNE
jgi:hypothetical protein